MSLKTTKKAENIRFKNLSNEDQQRGRSESTNAPAPNVSTMAPPTIGTLNLLSVPPLPNVALSRILHKPLIDSMVDSGSKVRKSMKDGG